MINCIHTFNRLLDHTSPDMHKIASMSMCRQRHPEIIYHATADSFVVAELCLHGIWCALALPCAHMPYNTYLSQALFMLLARCYDVRSNPVSRNTDESTRLIVAQLRKELLLTSSSCQNRQTGCQSALSCSGRRGCAVGRRQRGASTAPPRAGAARRARHDEGLG